MRTIVLCAALAGTAAVLHSQAPVKVPLRQGLTVVTAVAMAVGDGESIKRIEAIDAAGVHLSYSGEIERKSSSSGGFEDLLGGSTGKSAGTKPAQPNRQRVTAKRTIRQEDLKSARRYQANFSGTQPAVFPGTTAISLSSAVLLDLKQKGQAAFECVCQGGLEGALGGLAQAFGGLFGGSGGQAPPELKDLGDMGILRGTLKRSGPRSRAFRGPREQRAGRIARHSCAGAIGRPGWGLLHPR